MATKFIKSPFNYVGNKYKQLSQLMSIFPKHCNHFIDLMAGGLDVAINISERANIVIANDINPFVIEQIQAMKSISIEQLLDFIDKRIAEFQLSKTNEEGYLQYRDLYNHDSKYHTPLDLFVLTRFCFNNNLRFNESLKMNQAFGRNRSSFNSTQRKNTILFHEAIQSILINCQDFRNFNLNNFNKEDFIYIDPPYLISNASYNVQAKNANLRWEAKDDNSLMNWIDMLPTKWAMSNFLYHKGHSNEQMIEWIKQHNYNVYDIHSDYSHCTYNIREIKMPTLEVVITNYTIGE